MLRFFKNIFFSENKDVAFAYATMLALIQKGLQKDVIQETKPILSVISTTSNRHLPELTEENTGSYKKSKKGLVDKEF